MSELLPTVQAESVREGLVDYLTTTFALADDDAGDRLNEFLNDPTDGIFRGPYLRLRLPFRPADEGWRKHIGDWLTGFTPYGHQARAIARLTSIDLGPNKPRPLPTLVTTGTGSGKTEAFLYPIVDHVLRAKRAGQLGTKALILYPMNALANDQAQRLAALLTGNPALGGITAALYTGEEGPERTVVSADGLITDRYAIRHNAPDILLTNYKMLDQLLLRHDDAALWEQSAHSLQYLVLDEFHTYDGAQGTDVAMLLRRLGLRLKSHWTEASDVSDDDRLRPLGKLTPVATSATLGDKGDPAAMIEFAHTVFGELFDDDSVITESRLSVDEWSGDATERVEVIATGRNQDVDSDVIEQVNEAVATLAEDADSRTRALAVFGRLFDISSPSLASADAEFLLDLSRAHPFIRRLVDVSTNAVELRELAGLVLPSLSPSDADVDRRVAFVSNVAAALSHVRAIAGRAALSMDLHLWVRELTRIDRVATGSPTFLWSDDGEVELFDQSDVFDSRGADSFPAIYCRHCGRSGWGVSLAAVGYDLDSNDDTIRGKHAAKEGRFRALMFAPNEADQARNDDDLVDATRDGLRFFAVRQRRILDALPPDDDEDLLAGAVLPVLILVGDDADTDSQDDWCPSCLQPDGIRFLGSAIATLLSVTLSTMFGTEGLDLREKKALVFTDSVQDAAHRAGFVQSRSHTLTLRSVFRDAVGDEPITLADLVDEVLGRAGDDRFKRYRILPPELSERGEFPRFWDSATLRSVPTAVRSRVKNRLLFDASLEFGLQSHLGRTLELTGSVAAEVDAGAPERLSTLARPLLINFDIGVTFGSNMAAELQDSTLITWVRGVLERIRTRGGISHVWLTPYLKDDGKRWLIWGGRNRGQGVPAFPPGRPAPAFPRIGGNAQTGKKNDNLDAVASAQSWYAVWTKKMLGVSATDGGRLAVLLLRELAKRGTLTVTNSDSSAEIFALQPSLVVLSPTRTADIQAGRHTLVCDVCRTIVPGTATVVDQLADAPCTVMRCPGHLRRQGRGDNYYRRLYRSRDMRRIVSREHTSLLDAETRLRYENGFKSGHQEPQSPNVLVATPTLEMGIDIGDLSTVMLASLPRSVASYLQRVGRAGRLTGNALNLAFVTGRGENLPRLGDPLSIINGAVRPPATYLSADEILRRQYLAYLIDGFARSADRKHPRTAQAAIGQSGDNSFLGDLIIESETHTDAQLNIFLDSFSSLSAAAELGLRDWAKPADQPGSSALAQYLRSASQRWAKTVETLSFRRQQIEKILPELQKQAESPAAIDEDRRAFRSASAALKMTGKQLSVLKGEHWIAVLEEYGILPNYTLLDDSVTLDVALSWIDPDTERYETDAVSYKRGASNALRELAPGATFYAHGLEVLIDAVDLGTDGAAIRRWAHCPACGFASDLGESGKIVIVGSCPRCGSRAIADVRQRFEVVELERVSAEVRRDEALIGDRRDERKRERFAAFVAADIDPAHVVRQWFVENHGFGVKYLRTLTIRWINAGRAGVFAPASTIAGTDQSAPFFRVCGRCGKLDMTSRSNRPEEHRAWCPLRKSSQEDARVIALSRTLTTQGVVLRLPPAVTLGDRFAVPSLSAALLLGLREQIGGAPDHIQIEPVIDPTLSDGGDNYEALLLHDVVPGGTGYLAELADPTKMWDLLLRAYRKVRDCPCKNESHKRLACHLCLLPFTPPGLVDSVSREAAERLLRSLLLGSETSKEPGDTVGWTLTETPPAPVDHESHLEQEFRVAFGLRMAALGAVVAETPGPKGNKLLITGIGASGRWTLSPQQSVANSMPDFTLTSSDTSIPEVQIFTDGKAFHATNAHNRLADDSFKREVLRDAGHVVLGITWANLQDGAHPHPPAWFSEPLAMNLMDQFGYNRDALTGLIGGPLGFLTAWMSTASTGAWQRLANAVPGIISAAAQHKFGVAADTSLEETARLIVLGHQPPSSGGGEPTWAYQHGPLLAVCRAPGMNVTAAEIVVVLDDRASALDSAEFDQAWREWLSLSNALNLRRLTTNITTATRLLGEPGSDDDTNPAAAASPSSGAGEKAADALPPSWQAVVNALETDEEREFARELAALDVPPPALGLESDEGIPITFAWAEQRLAVEFLWDENDKRDLETSGWTVIAADPHEIARFLTGKEG
ncbi:DEAD/DEAH box helicase [Subtercola sp. RTI3]|uniref:DEAD/DEAH box helicase n=1 Tax=Subtercola sp. RTI3 TaxID=3048639 RepID=UPI002B223529|nr:DEAD/DEAH box helicase [Subtercola sp. RTI3]MEA9986068.1 DEAD/DEAH box helicase [Subtercola sp. RTI3]